jgi:predicted nucleic-acid-binding protein
LGQGQKQEIWLDTNIIIYTLRHNKEYSETAKQLITEAGDGNFTLKLSPLIVAECVWVLMGPDFRLDKNKVAEVVMKFMNLKGIETEEKEVLEEALTNFTKKGIDFTDAYLVAHAKAVTPSHEVSVNVRHFIKLGVKVSKPADIVVSVPNDKNKEGSA